MKNLVINKFLLDEQFSEGFCVDILDEDFMFYAILNNKVNWKDYQCSLCLKYLLTTTSLTAHLKLHVESGILHCDRCEYQTAIEEELDNHKYYHFNENCFYCKFCLKEYVTPEHLREHCCNKFHTICLVCSLDIVKFNKQVHHIQKCLKIKFIRYDCKFCDTSIDYFRGLIDHTKLHLDFDNYQINLMSYCDKCRKVNYSKNEARNHQKFHAVKRKRKRNTPKPKPKPKIIIICKFCEYKTSKKAHMTVHENRHLGIKPYKSSMCSYSSAISSDVIRHENRHERKNIIRQSNLSCE